MSEWRPARERNAERRRALVEEARRLAGRLAARGARRVVLFGSAARNEAGPPGDIDLLVVMDTHLPFVERAARLLEELGSAEAVDLLVYTPEEIAWMGERSAIVSEALRTGIVLHEAAAA
jgi:predicted nucleotidyltransferase